MDKKIPILALTGFLGSGKTSLLNHLLKENQGLKIGVIVNDFGSINIDSLLVARQTDSKLELSNGCICCASEDSGLDDAISQLAHHGSTLDYIVIEASGLAEPKELVNILEQSKNKFARLDSVVAVIDSENVLEMEKKHPDFFKQLEVADILILNKIDLVTKTKLKEIEGYLKFIGIKSQIIKSKMGEVDSRLLLDTDTLKRSVQQKGSQVQLGSDHSKHLHETFKKVSFTSTKPLDPKTFEDYMNNSIRSGVYRAKGFVYFGIKGLEQKFIFQLVGKRFSLKLDNWRGQVPKTDLVFIGEKLDEAKLTKDLEGLIDDSPDDIAGNLMDLNLYK